MAKKKRVTKESKYLKMVEKIKNEKIRAFLILIHFHMKEILFVLFLLALIIKKEWLLKIPYIGVIFK